MNRSYTRDRSNTPGSVSRMVWVSLWMAFCFQNKMEEQRSRRIQRIVEGLLPRTMDPKDRASETDLLLQFCLSLSKVNQRVLIAIQYSTPFEYRFETSIVRAHADPFAIYQMHKIRFIPYPLLTNLTTFSNVVQWCQ